MRSHKGVTASPDPPGDLEVGKIQKQIQTKETVKKQLAGWEEARVGS